MRTRIKKSALKTSEKLFIGIWIVTVILIFAFLTAFSLLYRNQEEYNDPIVTKLLNALNQSVDPCDDFYKFVCGADTDIVADKFRANLSQVLNARIAKGEWRPGILAKTFYKSCLNSGDNKEAIEQIKKLGSWPVLEEDAWDEDSFMWIDFLHKFRQEGYMEEMLMKFEIVPYLNNSEYIVQISPPQLYTINEYYSWISDEEPNKYLMLMVNISVSLGANKTKAEEQLQESLEFETELAKLSSSSTNRIQIMQISDLQNQYQSIKWLKLINGILPQDVSLEEDNIVAVVGQEYFFGFQDLMPKTSKRVQANYMFWRTLLEKIKYLPKATYDIYSKSSLVVGVKKSEKTVEQDCAVQTYYNMPYVINAMYLYYFDKSVARKATTIVKYLKHSLRRIILDLNWMDSSTKVLALKKLSKMQIAVADYGEEKIENYYKNLRINPETYFINALQVYKNARDNHYRRLSNQKDWIEESTESAYLHTENRIFIPATILQSPSYNASFPMYLNFGSLGWIVGSEIIRGFDNSGKIFDDKGNLSLWWSETTENAFDVYKQCIKNNSSLFDKNVNDFSIIDSQITHNLGIKLAYSAYYNWLKTHEKKAQGKSEYSSRQLFWISAAKVWCATTQNLTYLGTDDYPLNRHTRVIETFRNSEEFSAAFNCPKRSKMNPTKKCL